MKPIGESWAQAARGPKWKQGAGGDRGVLSNKNPDVDAGRAHQAAIVRGVRAAGAAVGGKQAYFQRPVDGNKRQHSEVPGMEVMRNARTWQNLPLMTASSCLKVSRMA